MRDKSFEVERRSVSPRRKLSFSNSNLDDPAHLDILYTQCCEQVVKGFHPVPRETAVRLAAIQSFIEFGPYESGKENAINAQNLLPKEYARARELEKNILQEYKECLTMFETKTAAKKRYCSICKNSATYGSVFSRSKKGNHLQSEGWLVDCLSWPLEQIRRWAASPTTFNIDFGDYTDGYYSVQTLEGEKMKKIIGNYIDIILKKSQIVDHTGIEGDEGGIMLESHVSTAKALPFMVENGRVSWRQTSTTSGIFSPPHNKGKLPTTLPFDDYAEPVCHAQGG
uniref:FERM domain-containing protein n=1 Tax=Ditylenchus dipsaci TaxID=166011 RepID=A0A915EUL8_9BILA